MTIKNKKVYINGKPVDDPLIIGNYVLQEATEAEIVEINFRSTIQKVMHRLISLEKEMSQLSFYMSDEKIDELFSNLPHLENPFTHTDTPQMSSIQLIQICEAYKNGLLII